MTLRLESGGAVADAWPEEGDGRHQYPGLEPLMGPWLLASAAFRATHLAGQCRAEARTKSGAPMRAFLVTFSLRTVGVRHLPPCPVSRQINRDAVTLPAFRWDAKLISVVASRCVGRAARRRASAYGDVQPASETH